MKVVTMLCAFLFPVLAACSAPTLFPHNVTSDMQAHPDFGIMMAEPDVFKGSAVQLAGRIVDVQRSNSGTLIIAQQLPVQNYPAYGPVDVTEPTGQFAVLYTGNVDPAGLWTGNKFMIAADMKGAQVVNIDGTVKSEPYLVARCMHVWKTGPYAQISDFPWIGAGYWPLEEQTYCTK